MLIYYLSCLLWSHEWINSSYNSCFDCSLLKVSLYNLRRCMDILFIQKTHGETLTLKMTTSDDIRFTLFFNSCYLWVQNVDPRVLVVLVTLDKGQILCRMFNKLVIWIPGPNRGCVWGQEYCVMDRHPAKMSWEEAHNANFSQLNMWEICIIIML